jgi:hypothetical protein
MVPGEYLSEWWSLLTASTARGESRWFGRALLVTLVMNVILGVTAGYFAWQSNDFSSRKLQLQNMIYNYPWSIFAYPKYEVSCNLNQPGPNRMVRLFVVIVTPHNGYAVVNQTFFRLSFDFYSKDNLDPDLLTYDNVTMHRETVFAVAAGSFQTTLEIPFVCELHLGFKSVRVSNSNREFDQPK